MGRPVLRFGETAHGFYNSGGSYKTRINGKKTKECSLWENIRIRCQILPEQDEKRFGKYTEVTVCDEWKDFQVFSEWFTSVVKSGYYQEGWQLDKDLLVKNNKVYAPEFCVFLPEDLNKALNIRSRNRGDLPLGITLASDGCSIDVQYKCKDSQFCVRKYLPADKIEDGFAIYKAARESYIKYLGEMYKSQIDPKVYEAIKNYSVDITD